MSDTRIDTLDWSQWLDFDKSDIANVPESEGVYKIHAAMKILFIGNSKNIRESLFGCFSDSCRSKARRFSYALIESSDKLKDELLKEYQSKHNGKLPECMES
jgi:excinuclease UvrABC nuclease subunit